MERAFSSSNAFELLGLPAQFDLDPGVIERAFFDKSKDLHADRFASAPAAERVAALSRSRALNDAYQVVKKPIARAEYLLARAGVTIGDNERVEPELLMEVLELREELAAAKAAGNTAMIESLRAQMATRREAAVRSLTELFERADLAAIKKQLILLRYLERYLDECDAALDED
ncbi:MAG TPA: Fe-S protein assembly co-chaperone HscB [Kofleriaceae bacterium]